MKKIVIIDDDMEFLDEISESLGAAGYIIIPVFSAASALAVIKSARPDVIFLDLKLGDVSGFSIAMELSELEETKRIPIIAMTGFYAENECEELKKACNIKKYLYKPIVPLNLITAIESVMRL